MKHGQGIDIISYTEIVEEEGIEREDRFEGQFFENRRHGFGVLITAEGCKYEGGWFDGKRHGQGKSTSVSVNHEEQGEEYDGEWQADRRHGQGVLVSLDGSKYEGQFAHDMKHGHGRLARPVYESTSTGFRQREAGLDSQAVESSGATTDGGIGQPIGWDIYVGEWARDQQHGSGRHEAADGETYEVRAPFHLPLSSHVSQRRFAYIRWLSDLTTIN